MEQLSVLVMKDLHSEFDMIEYVCDTKEEATSIAKRYANEFPERYVYIQSLHLTTKSAAYLNPGSHKFETVRRSWGRMEVE